MPNPMNESNAGESSALITELYKLKRFRHDYSGVREHPEGGYLWFDDVVKLVSEYLAQEATAREGAVKALHGILSAQSNEGTK